MSKKRHPQTEELRIKHQQKRNRASKQRHSQTGEQWMGNISRRELELSMQAEVLTDWRTKKGQHQQKKKRASKARHSHPGE